MAIMRAKKTAMITDARGKRRKITKGVTTADGDAQIVQDKPHLWGPLEVDWPAEAERILLGPEDMEQFAEDNPELVDELLQSKAVVPARNPTQNLAAPDLSSAPDPKGGPPVVVTATVRKWAQGQGIPVSKSGYIAKEVIESYIAAHS